MTTLEANELLVKSIKDFDLTNLKLAYENGADINYDPSLIWIKDNNNEYAVPTDDSIFIKALEQLGENIIREETEITRKQLEDKAFPVIEFCVQHGIRLNTFYSKQYKTNLGSYTENSFSIEHFIDCYSEKILAYLLENGLDPNVRLDEGYTICDHLRGNGNFDIDYDFEWGSLQLKLLQVLLDHGGKYSEDFES